VITAGNQLQHIFVHSYELVLSQGLLVFPLDQCFRDLRLKEVGLNGVYDLKSEDEISDYLR
jgi:hypothetical protein